jgi:hypothetical protein
LIADGNYGRPGVEGRGVVLTCICPMQQWRPPAMQAVIQPGQIHPLPDGLRATVSAMRAEGPVGNLSGVPAGNCPHPPGA